jgi:glutathione S-transferase
MHTTKPVAPITLYRHAVSGHSHRVELFMSLLGLPYTMVDVDLMRGAQKKPEFLAKNRFGQIPVIEDGGVTLADANAILVYLALSYADESWYPRAPQAAAAVQRFLSVAAGEIAYGPAAARTSNLFRSAQDAATIARANQVLAVLDGLLNDQPYLAAAHPTIADIACYTYLAHAPEGGVSLEPHAHVRAWIARIEALPGFVPMAKTPVGLLA